MAAVQGGNLIRVMITGAGGFVGKALVQRTQQESTCRVIEAHRTFLKVNGKVAPIDEIGPKMSWYQYLSGVDVIVHLAGRAHVDSSKADEAELFHHTNVAGTLALAKQAMEAGVSRFIFLSSIGVNGKSTNNESFTEQSELQPHAMYAQSKYKAECELQDLVAGSAMELVIVRPPLVYDYDAPGNFKKLLMLASSGVPLPFRGIRNTRSFVSRQNLVSFLLTCIDHPNAKNETFLVSDDEAVSLEQLIALLRKGMGVAPRLFYMPKFLILLVFVVIRRKQIYEQLLGNLEVDNSKAKNLLGWTPPVSAHLSLKRAGLKFERHKNGNHVTDNK